METRTPFRAGSFYDASPAACQQHAADLVRQASLPEDLPSPRFGGLVPHAGWVYSGLLAAQTFRALLDVPSPPQTVVLFGADHVGQVMLGEVFSRGAWQSPLGRIEIDEALADRLLKTGDPLRNNPDAHDREHSLEVQIPLIQVLAPQAKIVPIAVPVSALAVDVGRAVGRVLAGLNGQACVVGSTDLTHHGGHFGNRGGTGPQSDAFTVANDRRMLDRIRAMDPQGVLVEAIRHQNACGAGAVAATLSAVREMGAAAAFLLEYTNSYRITHQTNPHDPDDTAVGYASVVFT